MEMSSHQIRPRVVGRGGGGVSQFLGFPGPVRVGAVAVANPHPVKGCCVVSSPFVYRELHSGRGASSWLSSYRLISTGQLHTLLCFHIRPINPVV